VIEEALAGTHPKADCNIKELEEEGGGKKRRLILLESRLR